MSSLEILLNAERSLMDPETPYDFGLWEHCTCGHIYHAAKGEFGRAGAIFNDLVPADPYNEIMQEVVRVLGLEGKGTAAELVSEYTKTVSGLENFPHPDDPSISIGFPYSKVTREHSLKVIREAIAKIREMDQAVIVKTLDAHNYEAV